MLKIQKKWKIKKQKVKKTATVEEIAEVLLAQRGVEKEKEITEFFSPTSPDKISLKDFALDPKDMKALIKRVKIALEKKEGVVVYGDYDADGVCATAILWECLYAIGIDAVPYIPDRFNEGYGLNAKTISQLKKKDKNLKLIITVDNGIVAEDAVSAACKEEVDVIITDHHEPGETYPKAHAIVHSQKIGGAAIAWVVARELSHAFNVSIPNSLELAAIGTVSDQIELLGPNRSLVKYGIREMQTTSRTGLIEMLREARVDLSTIDTFTIGFVIAPRINAMGRLVHAIDSLRLLCTKNKARAKELSKYVAETNKKRQDVVNDIVDKALQEAKAQKDNDVIVIAHKDYHEGVVGLVASKLVETFYKPALVFSLSDDLAKASARSIPEFNIIKAIRKLKKYTKAAGGHPMAAGVSIAPKDLKIFTKEMNKIAKEALKGHKLAPTLEIDMELMFPHLSWELLRMLEMFAPTGAGNPTPLFTTNNVNITEARAVGADERHMKLKVEQDGHIFDAIGFGLGYRLKELEFSEPHNICYIFEENEFNGVKSMQLRLKDIQEAD